MRSIPAFSKKRQRVMVSWRWKVFMSKTVPSVIPFQSRVNSPKVDKGNVNAVSTLTLQLDGHTFSGSTNFALSFTNSKPIWTKQKAEPIRIRQIPIPGFPCLEWLRAAMELWLRGVGRHPESPLVATLCMEAHPSPLAGALPIQVYRIKTTSLLYLALLKLFTGKHTLILLLVFWRSFCRLVNFDRFIKETN